jgi:UDP-N-acetylmuramoyl-L-alanyl-D-glutamate--2,6-diaminopimelate ligase
VAGKRELTSTALLPVLEPLAIKGELPETVQGLAYDSRRVQAGDWFFALPGQHLDGAKFARAAMDAGAAAVVSEQSTGVVPEVKVGDARRSLARAAVRFFGEPASRLTTVGITGTNGKTTCSWLVRAILEAAGWKVGMVGTLGAFLAGEEEEISFTTPEAVELNTLLDRMVREGTRAAVLEVSSHGLALSRSYDIAFDVTVFTNLSQDHLDFHLTPDAYLDAKLRLFDGRNGAQSVKQTVAVINTGDDRAPAVLEAARLGHQKPLTYAVDGEADFVATDVTSHAGGARFRVRDGEGEHTVAIELPGEFNVENALAAWAAAAALGIPAEIRLQGLAGVRGVPGRLEPILAGQAFAVLVDYAHTPDGLGRALAAVRPLAEGKIHCVIGAGGDRDPGKRSEMGRVAAELSDRVIFTSDNPRSEDPGAIIRTLASGVAAGSETTIEIEVDRRTAIRLAISKARPGDLVLIAGKGHEATQTIGDQTLPFDDRHEARAAIESLRAGTEAS